MYKYSFQHQRWCAFMGHSDERIIQGDQHGSWFDVNWCPSTHRAYSLVSTAILCVCTLCPDKK